MFLAFTEDMADFVGDDAGEGAAEGPGGEPEGVVADAGGGQQNPAAIGLDEGQDVSIGDVGDAERAGVRQVRGLGMGRAGPGEADHDEAVEGLTVDGVFGAVPVDLEGLDIEQEGGFLLKSIENGGGDGVFGADVEADADGCRGQTGGRCAEGE